MDYAAAKDHVARRHRQIAPHDSVERFEGLGVRVIRAYGEFIDAAEVQGRRPRDHRPADRHRHRLLALGAADPRPRQVPYETNETIFDLRERPDHLLIIGGGPIGMEMAQAHLRLGCKVTVIEGAGPLARTIRNGRRWCSTRCATKGWRLAEGALADTISGEAGAIDRHLQGRAKLHRLSPADGRGPQAQYRRLNLDAGHPDHQGGIKVDDTLRTTNRRVYAIGDVAGGLQFTHVAGYHAGIIIRSALLSLPARRKTDHIPWATYTDPELAQVGLTEAKARDIHGDGSRSPASTYAENDRAIAERQTTGLIKVMVVKGRPVGASIAGPRRAN